MNGDKLRDNKEAEDGLRTEVQKLRATSGDARELLEQRRREAMEAEYRLRRRRGK